MKQFYIAKVDCDVKTDDSEVDVTFMKRSGQGYVLSANDCSAEPVKNIRIMGNPLTCRRGLYMFDEEVILKVKKSLGF